MLLQVSLSLCLADLYQETCFLLFNIMYFAHFTDFMLHNAHTVHVVMMDKMMMMMK